MVNELRRVDRVRHSGVLREVHRDVGALQEQIDVVTVRRVARDPDARLDVEREAADLERLIEGGERPLERPLELDGGAEGCGTRMPNSSPPRRATVSLPGRTDSSRRASSMSSRSP